MDAQHGLKGRLTQTVKNANQTCILYRNYLLSRDFIKERIDFF